MEGRIFKPENAKGPLPGMLFIHGGGYSMGTPEIALNLIEQLIAERPCVIVAPDYRKSIDFPFPAGFDDCYDTLLWFKENADSLRANSKQLIVAGRSAGGGMTAAISLKARDTKEVAIAFQMPIYPMIDNQQVTASAVQMTNVPLWNAKSNALGWKLYLRGGKTDNEQLSPYASPSRNQDYTDLPPTITFVGELDPFLDETVAYINALQKANVPVQFERFPGGFHGFEAIAPKTAIAKRANRFLIEAFASYYDSYC